MGGSWKPMVNKSISSNCSHEIALITQRKRLYLINGVLTSGCDIFLAKNLPYVFFICLMTAKGRAMREITSVLIFFIKRAIVTVCYIKCATMNLKKYTTLW